MGPRDLDELQEWILSLPPDVFLQMSEKYLELHEGDEQRELREKLEVLLKKLGDG